MEPDAGDSITPLKTRSNQRRSTSEVHTHEQRRAPSLQDKPVPDLSPPVDQRHVSNGIAPTKSRNPSLGSPLRTSTSPHSQSLDDADVTADAVHSSPRKSPRESSTGKQPSTEEQAFTEQ